MKRILLMTILCLTLLVAMSIPGTQQQPDTQTQLTIATAPTTAFNFSPQAVSNLLHPKSRTSSVLGGLIPEAQAQTTDAECAEKINNCTVNSYLVFYSCMQLNTTQTYCAKLAQAFLLECGNQTNCLPKVPVSWPSNN